MAGGEGTSFFHCKIILATRSSRMMIHPASDDICTRDVCKTTVLAMATRTVSDNGREDDLLYLLSNQRGLIDSDPMQSSARKSASPQQQHCSSRVITHQARARTASA